ncbi:MAG: restriction endonuclease subunit S [Bacteroidaceae bacterium]
MTTTINNKHKKLNVPNLRFPEFQGEWEKCTLNEVCKFHNGRAYKQTELLAAGKYRVLRVGNFFTNDSWYYSNLELEDNKYAQNGDLLYAWSASFGPRFWREEKVIFHYHIWKIDSFKNVDKNFLYHFLDLDSAKIKNEVQGGTMVHITKGDMEKRTISYPSVPEQRNIARFLFLLDERIATQNKIIEDLKKLKSAISHILFSAQKPNGSNRLDTLFSKARHIANVVMGQSPIFR